MRLLPTLLALAVSTLAGCKAEPSRSGGATPSPSGEGPLAPSAPARAAAALDVCVGDAHSCAIDGSGVVRCWGDNTAHQLGTRVGSNDAVQTSVPTIVPGVPPARALACSADASCAVSETGEVHCWGYATGFADVKERSFKLPFTGRVRDFTLTHDGGCAAGADGKVRCYARMSSLFDDVEVPGVDGATSFLPVPREDGRVCAARDGKPPACFRESARMPFKTIPREGRSRPTGGPLDISEVEEAPSLPSPKTVALPAGLGPMRVVRASADHACGIDQAGAVHCWGRATSGQLGDRVAYIHPPAKVPGLDDALSLSVGEGGACAVRREGTLVCWGRHADGDPPLGLREAPAPFRADEVAVGTSLLDAARVCAREAGTGIWRCRFGGTWLDVPKRFVGRPKPALLDARGGAWNLELHGAPTPTFFFSQVAIPVVALSHDGYCAVDTKGGLACGHCGACDAPRSALTTITADERFVLVSSLVRDAADETSVCALTQSGKTLCYAIDAAPFGRAEPKPLAIANLPTGGVDISAAGGRYEPNVTCVRTLSGEVHCFGDGRHGQNGGPPGAAKKVEGLPAVVGVGTGGSFACAREASGSIWCWGSNRDGGAPDGAPIERPEGVLVDLR